jgi:hypothetical protein
VHVADHLRRGQGSVSELLYALGNTALVLQVVTVTLVLVRHRSAPLVAALAGPSLAVGFFGAHWLPRWSAASDPVWEIDSLRWLSVAASVSEIAGAVLVGWAGASIWLSGVRHQRATGVRRPSCDTHVALSCMARRQTCHRPYRRAFFDRRLHRGPRGVWMLPEPGCSGPCPLSLELHHGPLPWPPELVMMGGDVRTNHIASVIVDRRSTGHHSTSGRTCSSTSIRSVRSARGLPTCGSP